MHLEAFVDDVHAVPHELTVYAEDRPEAVDRQLSQVVPPANYTVTDAGATDRPGLLLDVPTCDLALATPSVEAVPDSLLSIDGSLSITRSETIDVPEALSELGAVDETTFTLEAAGSDLVADAARHVTALALETAGGTTHVGLGSLSRLRSDDRWRRSCERLAEAGTLHAYGAAGTGTESIDVPWPVHHREAGELGAARFVVHDGADDPRRSMALLAYESAPGAYRGFLSFRPALVEDLTAYLERTYVRAARGGDDAVAPPS
jgi:hypothetical protein